MFRKLALSALAAVSVGATTLAPTPAAAGSWHGGWHGHHQGYHAWGPRFAFGAPVSYGYGLCYVQRLVPTPWGPRWRLVNSCY